MYGKLVNLNFGNIKNKVSYLIKDLLSGIDSSVRQPVLTVPPSGEISLGGFAEKFGVLNKYYFGKGV